MRLAICAFAGLAITELVVRNPALLPWVSVPALIALAIALVVSVDRSAAGRRWRRARSVAFVGRYKRTYLSAAALHDIHSPLTTVQGYLETLLQNSDKLDEQSRTEFLRTALHSSRRIERILDDLFFLSRADCNEVQLHPETFCVVEVVSDLVNSFRIRAAERNVSIACWATPRNKIMPVVADIMLIDRIFGNLLENALRHAPEGGRISVHMRLSGKTWCIRVSDNGPGIHAGHRKDIFKPFFRASDSGDSNCGLGLASASRMVKMHNGVIMARNNSAGGAVFTVMLPIAQMIPEPQMSSTAAVASLNSKPYTSR